MWLAYTSFREEHGKRPNNWPAGIHSCRIGSETGVETQRTRTLKHTCGAVNTMRLDKFVGGSHPCLKQLKNNQPYVVLLGSTCQPGGGGGGATGVEVTVGFKEGIIFLTRVWVAGSKGSRPVKLAAGKHIPLLQDVARGNQHHDTLVRNQDQAVAVKPRNIPIAGVLFHSGERKGGRATKSP